MAGFFFFVGLGCAVVWFACLVWMGSREDAEQEQKKQAVLAEQKQKRETSPFQIGRQVEVIVDGRRGMVVAMNEDATVITCRFPARNDALIQNDVHVAVSASGGGVFSGGSTSADTSGSVLYKTIDLHAYELRLRE